MWITHRINAGINLYYCPYRTLLPSWPTARIYLPCRTLSHSLSIVSICLSLTHTITLLVYGANMSIFVPRYCSPCLSRTYVCPCRTQLLSLSIAYICLSLSHVIALLVYRTHMSGLVFVTP